MADNKQTVSFPLYKVEVPAFPKNVAGIETDPEIRAHYQQGLKAYEDLVKSLEQRYAQPNWFKVAEAFSKPQLGGFIASLGSAAGVLGEQQEAQRAIAPTIAQMRSEIAMRQVGLAQQLKAAREAEKVTGSPSGLATPPQAGNIALYTEGPGKVPGAGAESEAQRMQRFINMFQAGTKYTDLVRQFGQEFVDQHLPTVQQQYQTQTQPPTAATTPIIKPSAPVQSPPQAGAPEVQAQASVLGVPPAALTGLTPAQMADVQAREVAERQKLRDTLNTNLEQQANQGAKLLELTSSIYKAAAKPSLAPAFGAFEGGDPVSLLGSVLEKQGISPAFAGMRDYITKAKLGKQSMSDLQVLEGLMGEMQTLIQQGIINPTDIRTAFEAQSIPNRISHQDAFLRGIARIASEGLTKYETKSAFESALKRPNFDVRNWTTSDEINQVNQNAKTRRDAVVGYPAVNEKGIPLGMPSWMMKSPSEAAYRVKPQESKPSARPKIRKLGNLTYEQQPDGSYKLKE